MEVSFPQVFAELGWVSIVVIVVMLLFTGKLRTSREMSEVRQDRDQKVAQISETAKIWREAYETERESRQRDQEALHESLRVSELTLEVVSSLAGVIHESPPKASKKREKGTPDDP